VSRFQQYADTLQVARVTGVGWEPSGGD
jgi:hypothetical protein